MKSSVGGHSGTPQLHHVEVYPSVRRGSVTVKHHYLHPSGVFEENHAFGPEEGHLAMQHLANVLKMKPSQGKNKASMESPRGAGPENAGPSGNSGYSKDAGKARPVGRDEFED